MGGRCQARGHARHVGRHPGRHRPAAGRLRARWKRRRRKRPRMGDTPINDVGDQGDTDEFGEARARPRRLPPQDGDLPRSSRRRATERGLDPERGRHRPQRAEPARHRRGPDARRHAQRARPRDLCRHCAELRPAAARSAGDEPRLQHHHVLQSRAVRAARHAHRQLPPVHRAADRRRLQQQRIRVAGRARRLRARAVAVGAARLQLGQSRRRDSRIRRPELSRQVSDGR